MEGGENYICEKGWDLADETVADADNKGLFKQTNNVYEINKQIVCRYGDVIRKDHAHKYGIR